MPLHFSIEEQTVPLDKGELAFSVDPSNAAIVNLTMTIADGSKHRLRFHRNGMFIDAAPVKDEPAADTDKSAAPASHADEDDGKPKGRHR